MDNIGYLFETIKEFRQRGLEVRNEMRTEIDSHLVQK